MAMQETVEQTTALIELLINERNKGKSLRQLGQMVGKSHERVRQILAKANYRRSQESLLPEARVAARLGYPRDWLVQLRKEGVINPVRPGGQWLYSEDQVKQIPLLIAGRKKCELCGKPRPPGYLKFCRECSRHRKKHYYKTLSPEKKAEHMKRIAAWRKANPEKWKEIQARGQRQRQAKVQAQASIISSNRKGG
jgi:hypothetical protein